MNDGFYLSTFLHIDELSHLLGVKLRHDQNISLWQKTGNDIELIRYWELERTTGLKQCSNPFFNVAITKEYINSLLLEFNLSIDDIVEVWGTPLIDTCSDYHSMDQYPYLAYHNISHLFSTVLLDSEKFFNSHIIGLAVDAAPENVVEEDAYNKQFYSGCIVRNGSIEIFPIYSPARLWSYAKNIFNKREGTLMALAHASISKMIFPKEDILELKDSNSYLQAKEYIDKLIDEIWCLTDDDIGERFNGFDDNFSLEDNRISMAMKAIQDMSNRIMDKNIENILNKYKIIAEDAYLAVAGGFSLNCPTNSYMMDKHKFKGFIAPPCVSDCGISLGSALYAFYKKTDGNKLNVKISGAYLGQEDYSIQDILNNGAYNDYIKNIEDFSSQSAVCDIKEAPIIWFNRAAEIGPRALGNRSILGDPRFKSTKDKLNEIKLREWWRPVAPIVIEEYGADYFEDYDESPYMLRTYKIKEEKITYIPAVAHLNKTARVQTLNSKQNNLLFEVIHEFMKDTGVPIICNTSLNDKGEPIINKIEEAINFALRKRIKIAYINGKRIEFQNHEKYIVDKPLVRDLSFIEPFNDEEKVSLLKKYNPNGITKDELTCYYDNYELMSTIDLEDKRDLRKLKLHTKSLIAQYGQIFERD